MQRIRNSSRDFRNRGVWRPRLARKKFQNIFLKISNFFYAKWNRLMFFPGLYLQYFREKKCLGKRVSDRCPFCGNTQTLLHILSNCPTALDQGRYTWRHNSVLSNIWLIRPKLAPDARMFSDLPVFFGSWWWFNSTSYPGHKPEAWYCYCERIIGRGDCLWIDLSLGWQYSP